MPRRLDHQAIAADYLSGMTTGEIAARHNSTTGSIGYALSMMRKARQFGLEPILHRDRHLDVDLDGFVRAYADGLSVNEIASEFGLTRTKVLTMIAQLAAEGRITQRRPSIEVPDSDIAAQIKAKRACDRHLRDLVAVYTSPLAVASLAQMNFARQSASPPFSHFARTPQGKVLI